MRQKKIILVATWMLTVVTMQAQNLNSAYFTDDFKYRHTMNPAYDNEQSYMSYYDEGELCSESSAAHYKSAIQVRNRSMVDRSDLVVCCIQRKSGGAYKTVQYALQQGKQVRNLSDSEL